MSIHGELLEEAEANAYKRGRKDGYQECLDKYGWMLNGLLYDEDLPEQDTDDE